MNQQHRIVKLFVQQFGRPPEWLSVAPGRVNLIGEHVDYCGGLVLPMAIDRSTMIAAAIGDVGQKPSVARISSTAFQDRVEIPLDGSLRPTSESGAHGWADYVRGVIAGFEARGGRLPAFDALIDSSVPLGGGLSSSAALEVAMATLLAGMTGDPITPLELALLCQRAEHDFAGVPCGIMDQFASTLCQQDHLLLLDCQSLEARQVAFDRDDLLVLIVNSNVRHQLGGGEYAQRRKDCERAARLLGVGSLREATAEQVENSREVLGDIGYRRARHVVTEIARTQAAAEALTSSRWHDVGKLMAASHASLRDDFSVSCFELDLLVELAAVQPGVIGSRLTGGGFGGCTVTLVEASRADKAMETIAAGYLQRSGRACSMFTTRPSQGARLLLTKPCDNWS